MYQSRMGARYKPDADSQTDSKRWILRELMLKRGANNILHALRTQCRNTSRKYFIFACLIAQIFIVMLSNARSKKTDCGHITLSATFDILPASGERVRAGTSAGNLF